jgi:UDP-N-acetylglucosamine--N-acetylmuramyl-(pentapeptide) pyrophosphoryl-undecaprenol N-acetylglucosamine transferase
VELLWVGGEGGMEAELVQREGIPYTSIPAAGVHGVGIRTLPGNIAKLTRGTLASRKILRDFKPDALFFTGGYVAVPMALAGWRVPSLLYVPDIEPGLALKALAWFADKITVTTPTSTAYFSRTERIVTTGYPLRNDLSQWEKATARKEFGLEADEPVLLVFGGSRGARSINNAVIANLPALLKRTQIVHISGKLDWETVKAAHNALDQRQAERYRVFDYLHEEMGAALASADLVISRAGASSLGEFPFFGLPALLVPYPYAWRYQKVNAEYLQEKGAARMVRDEDLQENLLSLISNLLENPQKLSEMRSAMQTLSHPNAAENIAQELLALARKR